MAAPSSGPSEVNSVPSPVQPQSSEVSGARNGNPPSGTQQVVAKNELEKIPQPQVSSQVAQQPRPEENAQQSMSVGAPRSACAPQPRETFVARADRETCCKNQGFWQACSNLASFYEIGTQGLPRDTSLAFRFNQMACAQGSGGDCSQPGQSVCVPQPGETFLASVDRVTCCQKNFGNACSNLAHFYETGTQGLPRDLSIAIDLKRMACKRGVTEDCFSSAIAGSSETNNLSNLSTSDRASIESACSGAKLLQGPAAYHRCLSTQLQELTQDPNAPDLSRLSSDDRASIESVCSGAKLLQGPAAYHRCLRNQLSELRGR